MTDGQNIRQLTSLRFFAAFWVVFYHYWENLAPGTPMFVEKGYLGVELFFVLSGFILCHVYRTAVEEGGFRYVSFLWNRLARVYPLHLATLLGMGILAGGATLAGLAVDPNILSWASLPANLFMVHAWGLAPQAGWNHPSWSISAEWFAYLSFPLFAWAALKLKNRPLIAVAGAAALLAGLYAVFPMFTGFPLTKATINWGALRIVPCFAFGAALHALWRAHTATSRRESALGAAFFGAAALSMAGFGAPDTLIVLTLGGLIFFLARLAQTGSKAFGNSAFVYLGEISYSIYMVCVPWKIVFTHGASSILKLNGDQLPPALWLAMLIGVIPLAAASYHLIEKPARARMKLWSEAWDVRRPSVAGA